ncbi:unnamed protein product [Meganyctiphanes norvegica]|uniref:BZIP domain-containing protein n=1 Tax=Meganyctiphanes norvegica TaxID=48144 RepID=A0AAV2RK18_MEGNR
MDLNAYNNSEGDLNFYDMDPYSSKYNNLFSQDTDTYKDILNTVSEIFPEQDTHLLLPEQDTTSFVDMYSDVDRGMDFSDSKQLLSDPYYANSPGAIGGFSATPMNTCVLPELSTSQRTRQPKKPKKIRANDRQLSPPDILYPDSSSIPSASGYSPYPNNVPYEDNYRESEVPIITFDEDNQITIFSNNNFGINENLEYQSSHLTENTDNLYNTISNTDFAASIEAEDSTSQDSHQTEDVDVSNLTDAEKYRRLRDLNNEASKRYRKNKTKKLSELAHDIPELEEKNRKLKNKSEQLELLRNNMLQYYNNTFNRQYKPHEVLLLKR